MHDESRKDASNIVTGTFTKCVRLEGDDGDAACNYKRKKTGKLSSKFMGRTLHDAVNEALTATSTASQRMMQPTYTTIMAQSFGTCK